MKRVSVTLPHKFTPRDYQFDPLRALDQGCKRLVLVWHRRAGKEKTCFAGAVSREAMRRVGTYYYGFPTLVQGRKILWDGIDKDGFKFTDHFPAEIVSGINNSEMKITLVNGSVVQVIGADHYDSIVGTNPVGIVLSEYSVQDPACWGYFRPMLAENGGWAIFNFTPRGENHAYDLWNLAKDDPFDRERNPQGWFASMQTVEDTRAIDAETLAKERAEIMRLYAGSDALYQQEYMCAFSVPIVGSYYAEHVAKAQREGRIGLVPHEPRLCVDTWWDLGHNDKNAIWFVQRVGAEVRVIDYISGSGKGLPQWAVEIQRLQQERGYVYGTHWGPHDIEVTDYSVGDKTRREVARGLGIDFQVVPRMPIADGIDAVRSLFPRVRFDAERCKEGINALKNYRKVFDEKRKTFGNVPYHDWSSNGADAFRYCASTIDTKRESKSTREPDRYERAMSRRDSTEHMGILG